MTTNYYGMKSVYFSPSQHFALNDFLAGTDNIAMMVSVKWKRPYINSGVVIRGNLVYTNLDPNLKDIIQQLAFNLVCEFKKERAKGKVITTYINARPTTENPTPRGSMAWYSRHDTLQDEHDYYVTFGDTGKDNFRIIINGYGTEVGAGELIGSTT